MADTKPFKTYDEQLALLEQRGMHVGDRDSAVEFLSRVNYYRLSGYWYPMRVFEANTNTALDQFQDGTSFELVKRLYEFDERLRNATFIELGKIETTVRTTIGHTLGRLSPSVHLEPNLLGARAHQTDRNSGLTTYAKWQLKYERALNTTKEDFVRHHKRRYDGILPVWAAVEIMDWGMLSHLYALSPNRARNEVARLCDLSAPQLESWLKSLNVVRNYSAHHARMFNRAYDLRPRLPSHPSLMEISGTTSRAFGQLSLVQYLLKTLHLAPGNLLPDTLESFPRNELVPFSRTGAPENWREHLLWRPTSEPT